MKTVITILTPTVLIATSALAQPSRVGGDRTKLYQSNSLGNQTFPNPDRDFGGGPYAPPSGAGTANHVR
jgi:hypothetical protein